MIYNQIITLSNTYPPAKVLKINHLCKFILHYWGIWRIFTWELGIILFGKLFFG